MKIFQFFTKRTQQILIRAMFVLKEVSFLIDEKQIRRFYQTDRQMHVMKKKLELATKRVIPYIYFLVISIYDAHITGAAYSRLRKHTFTHLINVVGQRSREKERERVRSNGQLVAFRLGTARSYTVRISVLSLYVPGLFKFVVGILH